MPDIRPLRLSSIVAIALWLATTGSPGAPAERSSLAVYSDICVHSESDDLLGTRVVVMRFVDGDYVLFQMAEGVMTKPELGKAVIDSGNGDILFSVPQSEKLVATFKGQMTGQFLTGTFDNHWVGGAGEKNFKLPRITGEQRSFPVCK